ncbi:MAG: hypothetical protein PHH70_01820 [Candidatus Gracilibacteria bacterium]|nr:hypothetical protein [Candidatus Gracilibacteria bacterium]
MNILHIIEGKADRWEQVKGYSCPGVIWARTLDGFGIYMDQGLSMNPDDIEAIGKYAIVLNLKQFGGVGWHNEDTFISRWNDYIPDIDENTDCGFYPYFSRPMYDLDTKSIYGYPGKIIGILEATEEHGAQAWQIRITKDFVFKISESSSDYNSISKGFKIGKKIGYEAYFRAQKEGEAYLRCDGTIRKVADTIEELLLEKEKLEINERA